MVLSRDTETHQNNISRLNEDIVLRLKLETELSSTRKDLTKAQKRELETRSFSDGIPKRLGDVEKASLPLQSFFKRSARRMMKAATDATTYSLVSTAPSAHPLIGTKCSERKSDSLNFPAPLYTLFLQLQ